MNKSRQTNASIWTGVAIGTLVGTVLILSGILIITVLLSKGNLQMDNIGYVVMGITLAAALLGSFTAAMTARSNLLISSLSTGAVLLLLLLAVTAVFFEGQFSGVPVTLVLVMGSSLAAALVSTKLLSTPKTYHKKR